MLSWRSKIKYMVLCLMSYIAHGLHLEYKIDHLMKHAETLSKTSCSGPGLNRWAVLAEVPDEVASCEPIADEALKAIAWATKLRDDGLVLAALRELPKEVVQEQIVLYREHLSVTAVAAASGATKKSQCQSSRKGCQ